jgi:transcriptional regulator with XRE-family HTH domain
MSVIDQELAGCLRAWRERLTPAAAGLTAGGRRRVSGLRREEVAALAGVSVDYLSRLEQGRAQAPSTSVLDALASALALSEAERSHLFRLAGLTEPGRGRINRELTPSLHRLLDRLHEVPVIVVDAAGEIVAANRLATALMGDVTATDRRERTLAWRHFMGMPSRVVRDADATTIWESTMVSELHEALGRFPDDEHLRSMIGDLIELSPRFAELWRQHPVARLPARRKTFRHPEVGDVTVDCEALSVHGSDLEVVVYTAPTGSPDARALELLGGVDLES